MVDRNRPIIKLYRGNEAWAAEWYQTDAVNMAAKGYFPTSQSWAPGAYGAGSFVIALLPCVVLIGFSPLFTC